MTSAVSTAMKQPKASPLSALKTSMPVQVGLITGTTMTSPARAADTPTNTLRRFQRSDSRPPTTVETAIATIDTGVRTAIAAGGVSPSGSVMWSPRMYSW